MKAEIFLVAAVLFPEATGLTDALIMKNAPQGRHIPIIIQWDIGVQLRGELVSLQLLTFQLFVCVLIYELLQQFECSTGWFALRLTVFTG